VIYLADRRTGLPLSHCDIEEIIIPSTIEIDSLVLIPMKYGEDTDLDGCLSINARFCLSEAQYADVGKLPDVVKVVRRGNDIDETPREMDLTEIAWSKRDNGIHEQILLRDKDNILSNFTCLDNSVALVVKQGMIIDELIKMLVSAKIISQRQIDGLMAEITDEKVKERMRDLNQLKNDLNDYEF
jgi:hypothetical protein